MNITIALSVGAIITVLSLGGCDSIFESSKFNIASEQVGRVPNTDIVNRDEFKINMPRFLAQQIAQLAAPLAAQETPPGYGPALAAPDVCSANALNISQVLGSSELRALADDKVTRAFLETVSIGGATAISGAVDASGDDMGYADFVNSLRRITDAKSASATALNLYGVEDSAVVSGEPSFVSLLTPSLEPPPSPAKKPLLAYLGAYYNGKFADHFGNILEQPSIKNGIDDGTIARFTQVIFELAADLIPPQQETLLSSGPIYHPKNEEPTYHKVFKLDYEVKDSGANGISAKEAKVIATGANLIAEQGLTFFSGVFEALSEIHIGFIIAGNFAVGGNDTLKSFARAVIETGLRRGAERGLYCLVAKYNFDAVADVIEGATKK